MHDIESIEHLESFKQLSKNAKSFLFWKLSLFFDCIHDSASIAILIHKIVVVSGLKMILISDDELAWADGW